MFSQIIKEHNDVINQLMGTCQSQIEKLAALCQKALNAECKIYFMGNGGSAADCQHLAAEFVGRFQKERKALPALALTTDTSILTAVGNDYGFEQIFVRQLQAFVKPNEIVIGLSTSGNSINIIKAIQTAREHGAIAVGMTGRHGGRLAEICDICIKVPSDVTARIQEAHILVGHAVCQMIDEVTPGV